MKDITTYISEAIVSGNDSNDINESVKDKAIAYFKELKKMHTNYLKSNDVEAASKEYADIIKKYKLNKLAVAEFDRYIKNKPSAKDLNEYLFDSDNVHYILMDMGVEEEDDAYELADEVIAKLSFVKESADVNENKLVKIALQVYPNGTESDSYIMYDSKTRKVTKVNYDKKEPELHLDFQVGDKITKEFLSEFLGESAETNESSVRPLSMADFFEQNINKAKGFKDFIKMAKKAGFSESQAKSVIHDYEQGGEDYVHIHHAQVFINENGVNEAEVKSAADFKKYTEKLLKAAHGEDYDEAKADKTASDLIEKYGDDFGAMVGALQAGLAD